MSSFKDLKAGRKARQGERSNQLFSSNSDGSDDTTVSNNATLFAQANEVLSRRLGRDITLSDERAESSSKKKEVEKDKQSHDLYGTELDQAGLEAHNIPGRGRGLISINQIKPGTRILRTPPSIATLSNQHLQRTCHGCFLTLEEKQISTFSSERERIEKKMRGELKTKLNRCSLCKVIHYCSKECQVSDWPTHKHECMALRRFKKMYFKSYPNRKENDEDTSWVSIDAVRALARIIWKRKDEREKNGGKDGIWWKQIASLESHVKLSPEKEVMKLAQQAQHLQHYISASKPLKQGEDENTLEPANLEEYGFESVSDIMNLCSSFHVNSFTLSSPSLSPIGVSNSPLLALSNHSCDPNACVVYPNGGRWMELIAIRDIKPGEEILTSYIDISCPYHIRQSDILERYRFKCNCVLCEKSKDDESNWMDPRWCIRHVGCRNGIGKDGKEGKARMPDHGSTGRMMSKCDSCEEGFEIDSSKVLSLVNEGIEILDRDEQGKLEYSTARSTLETLIPKLQSAIPNTSYPLLSLLRLSSLIHNPPKTPQDLDIAISHISQAYTAATCPSKLSKSTKSPQTKDQDQERPITVYPINHPVPTIISAEKAKLLSLSDTEESDQIHIPKMRDEKMDKIIHAMKNLNSAIDKCKLSFGGAGGLVGKELNGILDGCKDELESMRFRMMKMSK
ncbi:uncharacterized protein IL334_006956 [Kwoniella shivajii]|uniref:SET domain-containing protein n=1 Tax=Kwoniella shivajii TaxID=564305 RepID=A0ABZ1D9F8_9TREE|nr:hypothetical protein IL334_006956 [Kwoniella shivajii]